ncbi:MAG: DciA family protein [Puniceicoccales bacterium]|nr:DciA family protein [Puniceicoccales bacterium]
MQLGLFDEPQEGAPTYDDVKKSEYAKTIRNIWKDIVGGELAKNSKVRGFIENRNCLNLYVDTRARVMAEKLRGMREHIRRYICHVLCLERVIVTIEVHEEDVLLDTKWL